MHRTKILISIDWFLPGTKSGGPVRSYANLIEQLDEGFEFFIITRNTDFGTNEPYKDIIPNIWTKFNNYTKVFYCSADYLNKKHLKQLFTNTHFDVAYVNGIYSYYFSILPVLLLKATSKPVIVSARGMLNPQAFSVKPFKKKVFINMAKLFSFYKNVQFHATNNEEASYIKGVLGNSVEVKVAANLPRALQLSLKNNISKHSPVRFVNLARVSKEKGTLKMLNCLTQVNEALSLDLYGPIYDENYWEKCQAVIANLPDKIIVNYKGVAASVEVPELLAEYDFFVLLSEGENFGHAILEALASGLPVLISNQTPWRNLKKDSVGWDVDINDENEIMAAFNVAINMTNHTYKQWSRSAYSYAKEFIENPKVLEENKALFLGN